MLRKKAWIDAVLPVFFWTSRAPGNCGVFIFVFPIIPACEAGGTILVVVAKFGGVCFNMLEDSGKHRMRKVVIGNAQKVGKRN